MDPIAIVGIGCRFPGGASDPRSYWQLLQTGGSGITQVPPDRWDLEDLSPTGKAISRWGGFLAQVDQFDASFFQIAPQEARVMDPQQRLVLEVAWEALEHAAINPEDLAATPTGVFLGISNADYHRLVYQDQTQLSGHAGTGTSFSIAANRLSYALNLRGPSLVVDTACSSSLVAVHLACQSLRQQESDLCFAGGVNLMLTPEPTIAFSQAQMMAADGYCKTFDARADGYVRGEGCGIILLKRLPDALRDQDTILALIPGSAVNQDGYTNGLTAPNGLSQQAVIRQALANGDVDPVEISYVEAHGTGTVLGDPIEVKALKAVLLPGRTLDQSCWLGSVKTNIGHLEAAAGIAGLIKVVLALQEQEIPPHLHLQQLNPLITLQGTPLQIPTQPQPWPRGEQQRVAGVSSFGFGGTNAHVILTEAPVPSPKAAGLDPPLHLLPLSAKTETALQDLRLTYQAFLRNSQDQDLADICYTASIGRAHFRHRLVVLASSRQQVLEQLERIDHGDSGPGTSQGIVNLQGAPQISMLFTGQGSQYAGMGQQLYSTQPTFRAMLDRCADLLQPYLDKPLLDILFASEGSELDQTGYAQPALFALEYSLAQLWITWGIRPDAVLGHSVGEYVAAGVAGIFSLEDGLKLIAARGRLTQQMSPEGEMVALMASVEQVKSWMNGRGDLAIAAVNGPESTVISGSQAAVQALISQLSQQGIKSKTLPVSHAFHSPLMQPILTPFRQVADQVRYSQPQISFISTVTGREEKEKVATPDYWCEQILKPVQFAAAMTTLHQQGSEIVLECGPQPILLGMGRQCWPEGTGVWLPSLRSGQPEWQTLLTSLAELYVRGVNINWRSFGRDYPQWRRTQLPTYPFQRQRYWLDPPTSRQVSTVKTDKDPSASLLGQRLSLPFLSQIRFQTHFTAASPAYLRDHQFFNKIVVAGASHLIMAWLTAQQVLNRDTCIIHQLQFLEVLAVTEERPRTVQVIADPLPEGGYRFKLVSSSADQASELTNPWTTHVSATLQPLLAGVNQNSRGWDLQQIQDRCSEKLDRQAYYTTLLTSVQEKFHLGESFRWTDQVWIGHGEALLKLQPPGITRTPEHAHWPHPGLLDAGWVAIPFLYARQSHADFSSTYAVTGVTHCQVFQAPDLQAQYWVYVQIDPHGSTTLETLQGDAHLLDQQGQILISCTGIRFRKLHSQALTQVFRPDLGNWFYNLQWQKSALATKTSTRTGTWILFTPEHSQIGQHLRRRLQQQGGQIIEVLPLSAPFQQIQDDRVLIHPTQPEDFRQLMLNLRDQPLAGIIHLWSLDTSVTDLTRAQEQICGSTLHLIQSLALLADQPPLWLVTQGAQALQGGPDLQPQQASLWGLGRVISLEYPHLSCHCLDLDPEEDTAPQTDRLLQDLLSSPEEPQIAYRQGERWIPRLQPLRLDPQSPIQLQANASYCITGGLGSLGLQVGRWLVDQGARQLVLVGRQPPSPQAEKAMTAMQQTGAQIAVIQTDVTRAEDVVGLLDQITTSLPPLRGIIHAAGVLDDGLLQQQSWDRFSRVLAPKIQGAWNLHQQTLPLNLDFFVCFSSVTALLGNVGQGSYAAANAFMDALIHERRRLGHPGLSLNWGPWDQEGMVTHRGDQVQRRLQAQGMQPIPPQLGCQILGQVLGCRESQIGIFQVDWDPFLGQFSGGQIPAVLAELVANLDLNLHPRTPSLPGLVNQLQTLSPEQRQPLLVDYLSKVVAKALGRNPSDPPDVQEGFFSLGMDSLMAVDLVAMLRRDLGITLAPTLAFEYANIEALAAYLGDHGPVPERGKPEHDDIKLILEVGQMSEDELQESLLQELDQLEASLNQF